MADERPLVRDWAVAAVGLLHTAPVVAAFWIGEAAQAWLAASCFAVAVLVAASWLVLALRRRVWAGDAAARGAAWNAVAGAGCELSLGLLLLAVPGMFR